MNKILKKISAAVQLILLAPVKLPGKALNIMKYVALGLGILESVTRETEDTVEDEGRPALNLEQDEGNEEEV